MFKHKFIFTNDPLSGLRPHYGGHRMTNVQQLLQKHRAVRDLFPLRKFINLKTFKAEREDLFWEGSSKQSIMYRLGCNAMCPTLAMQYLCQKTNKSRDPSKRLCGREREGMMNIRQQCVERERDRER